MMQPSQGTAPQYFTPMAPQPYRVDSSTRSLKITGIIQIVLGSVLAALGISAIGIAATFSYVALPIWSGLLFILLAGILGVVSYYKTSNRALLASYFAFCIVSACSSFTMFVLYIISAATEYWSYCYPLGYYDEYYCRGPKWSRIMIDSFIVVVAAFECTVSIVAASFAGYKMCSCCRTCCSGNNESQQSPISMMAYPQNGGSVVMPSPQTHQATGPVYVGGQQDTVAQPNSQFHGQQYIVAQPSGQNQGQLMVAQPSGQPMIQIPFQAQHDTVAQPNSQSQNQQYIVAQPSGQIQGQPARFQSQQFMVAQPSGQPMIQIPFQGQQVTVPQSSSQSQGQQYIVAQQSGQTQGQPARFQSQIFMVAQPSDQPMIQSPIHGQPFIVVSPETDQGSETNQHGVANRGSQDPTTMALSADVKPVDNPQGSIQSGDGGGSDAESHAQGNREDLTDITNTERLDDRALLV